MGSGIICKLCGRSSDQVKEWVHCGKCGEVICWHCCKECIYCMYDTDTCMALCRYKTASSKEAEEKEKERRKEQRTQNEVERLLQKARWLYRNNRPRQAERVEAAAMHIMRNRKGKEGSNEE